MKPKVKKPTEKERQEAESWPIWEKDESKFPWEYDLQETCLIWREKPSSRRQKEMSSLAQATM
jgi:uncharacterized cupin superfamily protein